MQWLLKRQSSGFDEDTDELLAYSLAKDFVQWTDGEDTKRQAVLKLFEDDDWYSRSDSVATSLLDDEDGNEFY